MHDCRPASEATKPILFCQAVFSVQCSVAVAAHLPSSFRSNPQLDVSRLVHTSTSLPDFGK